jgi:hypothetical protein
VIGVPGEDTAEGDRRQAGDDHFPVTRSDTGQPLTTGTMVGTPFVAGKAIAHSSSFRAGKARVSFVIPASAKGKLLTVKVTIKTGTRSATRVATLRVS